MLAALLLLGLFHSPGYICHQLFQIILREEATMIWDWHKTAAERAIQSPLNDYERRDLLRSRAYRFSLHGLHFGLHPDVHVVQSRRQG